MAKPTPEQMEEFKQWEATQKTSPASAEAIKGVIDDDMNEAEQEANKKLKWNREYNHAPGPVEPRILAEDERKDS